MSIEVFSPGRTELAGNHTDHQKGRVLASAVDFGLVATADKTGTDIIHILSEGFSPFEVNINHMRIRAEQFGSPKSLVRGVIAGFREYGLCVGSFNAIIKSTLPAGLGLSSSAAFAVCIAKIVNELYNDGAISPIVLARIAQFAENRYFGKPCGLMDQTACAVGHPVYIDFLTNEVSPINADFSQMGLTLCLTNTGGSHAGLDSSYGRIPADMKYIAHFFDKEVLGEVNPEDFRAKGWNSEDRPVRRAMHFFDENERVPLMRDALIAGDGKTYMRLMNESGRSSEELLNNIITSATGDTKLAEGLELSKQLLEGRGAWRVHGGGFAGCVQALMPSDYFPVYKEKMEEKFGENTCWEIKLK